LSNRARPVADGMARSAAGARRSSDDVSLDPHLSLGAVAVPGAPR